MQLLRKLTPHRLRHLITRENITILVALLIAAGWAWGTVTTLQKNFALQKELDALNQGNQILELRTKSLQFEQQYYESDEYLELAAREWLDKGLPGEKLVILPDSSKVKDKTAAAPRKIEEPSNFSQWMMFFFGDKSRTS